MDKKLLLLKILNDIDKGNKINHETYEVDLQLFGDIVDMAIDEEFIKCTRPTRGGQGNPVRFAFTDGAKITLSGLNYLEKHNIIPM